MSWAQSLTRNQSPGVSAGQECPQNRPKNDCSERRFGRQQTQRLPRRRRRRCSFQEASASLQGGYPPHTVLSHTGDEGHRGVVTVWTSSTGTLAFGAIDFACRSLSWFSCRAEVREIRVSKARRLSLPTRTPRTTGTPSTGTSAMVCTNQSPERGIYSMEFRNFCRVLTASSPTGDTPPGPHGGRAAPPHPPCPGRRQYRRRRCCRLNPARTAPDG
jgi:hypothetical protein